ncbi:MAG: peptidyl-prolyl cis-trans isomerase [Lachnospiraceae bacterium]|nr:peptidyl-prolyl cis-trans isomerase [Lachnospiraceae bacterium]
MSNKVIKEAKLNTSKKKKPSQQRLEQTTGTGKSLGARTILIAIGIVVVLIACVYVGIDQMSPKVVVTVDNKKYTLNDVGYYIYQGELQGNYMASFYAQLGTDYWNGELDDEGTTGADQTADSVMSEITRYATIYQEAVAKGYSATDEDKKTAQNETDTLTKDMTTKQKMITGLSEKEIYNAILEKTIAERYRKDVITSLKVDYDKATKDITKKDYKQYDFQYYFVSTKSTDDKGKETDMSDDQKAELKTKMEEIAKKAKTEKDFTKLIGEDEKTIQFNEDGQLLAKDAGNENTGFDVKLDTKITKMKKDEISKVLEGENGFYVIKLTDNTSTESYDDAIKSAKDEADTNAFNEEYTNNIEPNHTTNINYDEWEKVPFGSYSS